MDTLKQIALFDNFNVQEKDIYDQAKIKTDREMFRYLKQFIVLEEENITRYKHKLGYYHKKAHYINGKKVNRQIFNYVKKWLETI